LKVPDYLDKGMKKLTIRQMLVNSLWILPLLQACSFSARSSRKLLEEARKDPSDLVVVPGVPFNGEWDKVMKGRIYWSKYLYDQGIVRNIMFSGAAVYTPYTESEIMSLYAQALGIPKEHIFTETKAEHSTQNIYYGYRKARSLQFKKIALASDPFQTRLLKSFARRKLSRDVRLIPMVVDTLKSLEPYMINPSIPYGEAHVEDFVPLSKRQGWWKRLKGTLGLDIDKQAYP
jgi:uncharacterized SAM-binding protein YcdF (DUF218 family)